MMLKLGLIRSVVVLVMANAAVASAQDAQPETREALIAQEQAAKVATEQPYMPNPAEVWAERAQSFLGGGGLRWYPFFHSAYAGGGFTLGAGYIRHVSPYNT